MEPVTAGRRHRVAPSTFGLVIGAMKSGTTSLFEILVQHPEIAGCREKEPEFFSDVETHSRGWDWYVKLWDWNPKVHKVALEASTSYSRAPGRPHVPERIASVSGATFKFIYMMRDPADQISSHLRHNLYGGWGQSLDDGIPDYVTNTARYAMQIDQYVAYFPREALLLVTLEEFRDDPDTVLRRVCEFLGVSHDFRFPATDQRYNRGDLYEVAPRWASLIKAAPVRAAANRLLSRSMRHWLRERLPRIAKGKSSLGRYKLTEAERASVYERLGQDIARLQSTYGVDVGRYWSLPGLSEGPG